MSLEKQNVQGPTKDSPSRVEEGIIAAAAVNEMPADEKERRRTSEQRAITQREVDDTTVFYNTHKDKAGPLTPEIERRLVRKNFWFLLAQTWWIAFLIHLDKGTISSASTMGIFDDVDMTKAEFNNLFMIFYVGYLISLWPGAWISQRIGQKHTITGSIFLWAVFVGMHPLAKTGGQLTALRFLLGLVSLTHIRRHIIRHSNYAPNAVANYRHRPRSCQARPWCTKPFSLPRKAHGFSWYGGLPEARQTSS